MLTILEQRAQQVALEAFSAQDVLGLVKSVYADITSAFSGFVAHFNPSEQPALQMTSDQQKFLRDLQARSYSTLRAVSVATPEGLESTYLEYLARLEKAVAHSVAMPQSTLYPFATFLASLVNNFDATRSTQLLDIRYPSLEVDRKKLIGQMASCFEKGSHRAERAYELVIARNSDWPELFKRTDAAIQAINKVDRKALDKKAKECVELLGVIQKKLERGDFNELSPEVAKNLAQGAYQVASELEFFAVVYYKSAALSGSINRAVGQLRAIIAQK